MTIFGIRPGGWLRLSVRAKLLSIVVVLVVALLVINLLAANAVSSQSAEVAELRQASAAQFLQQNADMLHDSLRAGVYRRMAGVEQSSSGLDDLRREMASDAAELRDDIRRIRASTDSPELQAMLDKNAVLANRYTTLALDLINSDPGSRANLREALGTYEESFLELKNALAGQAMIFNQRMDQANLRAEGTGSAAKKQIFVVTVLLSVFTALLVWILARSVRRALRVVRDSAHEMAAGRLEVRTSVGAADELGELSTALNQMAENLQKMLGQARSDATRDAFGAQLVEALEMADTEAQTHHMIGRAMKSIASDRPMELLLADSSRTHLEVAALHPMAGGAGCTVESPFSCIAVRRGNPVVFEDSEALNACPRLRDRRCGPISAECIPVSFMGHSLGVLHSVGPVGSPPSAEQMQQLTVLGIQAGARIGTVRAFQSTQFKASTDSLTGLMNRRSLEEKVRDLAADGKSYAVVLADLDYFKRLNDTYGHDAGDAALRAFSELLRHTVRTGDFAARWGGEEFVVVMPGASAAVALEAVNRVRAGLAERLVATGGHIFTASFGIAETRMSTNFDHLVRIADDALYQSKEDGRDRATVGDPARVPSVVPRRENETSGGIDLGAMSRAV